MKIRQWFKNRLKELEIEDPNSPEGLKERARRMIKKGFPTDSPYVSALIKLALLKEKRDKEIPDPEKWELMSAEEKEDWVIQQLGGKIN